MRNSGYSFTRRHGKPGSIVRVTAVTTDPDTGDRTTTEQVTNLMFLARTPTSLNRITAANQAQRTVGDTTFTIWTREVTFRELTADDYFVQDGLKYQVVTSEVNEDALVCTAKRISASDATVNVTVSLSQSLGMSDEVEQG